MSEEDIAAIERRYNQMKSNVEDMNMEEVINGLQDEVKKNQEILDAYTAHIGRLETDIENLRQIRESIPAKCWNEDPVEKP